MHARMYLFFVYVLVFVFNGWNYYYFGLTSYCDTLTQLHEYFVCIFIHIIKYIAFTLNFSAHKMASANNLGDDHVAVQKLQPDARIYERLLKLGDFYEQQYFTEPEFYVRVPGR